MVPVISGGGNTNSIGPSTRSCFPLLEPRRQDPNDLTCEHRRQMWVRKEVNSEEAAQPLDLQLNSLIRYCLEKHSKVEDVPYFVEDNNGGVSTIKDDSSTEDDDGGSSSEDDDGGSSTEEEEDGSSTENDDGGSCTEDDDGGSSTEDDDCALSVENNDFGLSVTPKLAHDLTDWEEMEYTEPKPTEVEKAVKALHIVRCQEFTEVDPKFGYAVPTRFCLFNIALFDFEKESLAGLGPPLCMLAESEKRLLDTSVNIVSMKILESDVGFPISVFGTILARDDVDFKCVYLFRCSRDSPQVITSPNDMLTLTGPFRGLAATYHTFFEIDLKIKGDDCDKDFSKGVIEHCGTNCSDTKALVTRHLTSWMSTMQLVYTCVPQALEATVAIKILNGPRSFKVGVTAWTSRNMNKIILHDSKGAVTSTDVDGSIKLSRCLVVVPVNQELMMAISVHDGDHKAPLKFQLTLKQSDNELICNQGSCELQVNVTWTSMLVTRNLEVYENIGSIIMLL